VDRCGESVVLVDRRVVRLSPLAVTLLDLLDARDEWALDHELAGELVDRFGVPPEGRTPLESTRTALRDLEAEGLVDLD
jgi:hypothetical protein